MKLIDTETEKFVIAFSKYVLLFVISLGMFPFLAGYPLIPRTHRIYMFAWPQLLLPSLYFRDSRESLVHFGRQYSLMGVISFWCLFGLCSVWLTRKLKLWQTALLTYFSIAVVAFLLLLLLHMFGIECGLDAP